MRTTKMADELASRYPLVRANREVLYVNDNDIITSAARQRPLIAACISCVSDTALPLQITSRGA